ncbi:VOC family protein [Paenibacillus tarimensis]
MSVQKNNKSSDSNSPIRNHVGAVYVPVRDMNRAVTWYNRLLGRDRDVNYNPEVPSEEKTIYSLALGETNILLDSIGRDHVRASKNVLFNLKTDDLHASYQYLKEMKANILTPEEDAIYSIMLADPDGNLIKIHKD